MAACKIPQTKAQLSPREEPLPARTPGSMSGQIRIAPDFDTLPEDIKPSARENRRPDAEAGLEVPRWLEPVSTLARVAILEPAPGHDVRRHPRGE